MGGNESVALAKQANGEAESGCGIMVRQRLLSFERKWIGIVANQEA